MTPSWRERLRDDAGYVDPGSSNFIAQMLIGGMMLLIFLLVPLWGIIDAAVRPDGAWKRADQNKIVWVLVMIFVPIIGALAYFFAVRPKVKRAAFDPGQSG